VSEKGHQELPLLSVYRDWGVVPREGRTDNNNKASEDLSGYQRVLPGDLVLNKMKTWQGSLGVSSHEGIVSPAYIVCRVDPGSVHGPFLHHLLRSAPYIASYGALSKGIRPQQWDLLWDQFRTLPVLLPSVTEQHRIADFLDDQVVGLDRAILLREQQMRLLEESALAQMAEVLSGNVDQQTGVETGWPWLPLIPSDWSLGPVYGYFDVRLGKMINPERASGSHLRPYLRNANVRWFSITTEDVSEMSFEPQERSRYRLRTGDVLVCEGGATKTAEAAIWNGEIEECYYQKSLHRVRATSHLPAEWLLYWLRLAKHSGVFVSEGNLATIPHLTGEQLREHRIPVPPKGAIALDHLHSFLRDKEHLVALQNQSINLLRERKQALVTAAVAGQFDVTTARRGA
jgi:type I restriction enzyme S subunit